jgi:riboflavin synthase
MFTGIVAAVGRIVEVQPSFASEETTGLRVRIDAKHFDLSDVAVGDSIAVQGACMTVVALQDHCFEIDVSRESLDCTVGLDRKGDVNLEKSLRLSDVLSGHLVFGHVDGLGEIIRDEAVGESRRLIVQVPQNLAKYMAYKGSIALNGISLTVNGVQDNDGGCEISLNIIPHTQHNTTLRHVKISDKVNLEIDMLARYIERMVHR